MEAVKCLSLVRELIFASRSRAAKQPELFPLRASVAYRFAAVAAGEKKHWSIHRFDMASGAEKRFRRGRMLTCVLFLTLLLFSPFASLSLPPHSMFAVIWQFGKVRWCQWAQTSDKAGEGKMKSRVEWKWRDVQIRSESGVWCFLFFTVAFACGGLRWWSAL